MLGRPRVRQPAWLRSVGGDFGAFVQKAWDRDSEALACDLYCVGTGMGAPPSVFAGPRFGKAGCAGRRRQAGPLADVEGVGLGDAPGKRFLRRRPQPLPLPGWLALAHGLGAEAILPCL